MGITAENIARQWQLSRSEQDEFALASQHKAEAAQKAGRFDGRSLPFTVKARKRGVVVSADEIYPSGHDDGGAGQAEAGF
ncbi:hypothetical protein VXQ18_05775 [Brucella abortus]|nr:hypothetical protein [Brucella abortus]